MELKEVKVVKEKRSNDIGYEDRAELRMDSEQFPDLKGLGSTKNIKMTIEGEITHFSRDVKTGKESYTILIKKAGVERKDSRQIQAKSSEEGGE